MSITVPTQAPGAKSLPAQMRVSPNVNGMMRLRAQHPGYPMGLTVVPMSQPYVRGMSGGMDMIARQPLSVRGRGGIMVMSGMYGLGLGRLRGLRGFRGLGQDDTSDLTGEGDNLGDQSGGDFSIPTDISNLPDTSLTPSDLLPGAVVTSGDVTYPSLMCGSSACSASSLYDNPAAVFGTSTVSDQASAAQLANLLPPLSAYSGPTVLPAGSATPAAPSGYQWATLANQAGTTLAKVLAISQGGSSVTLPNGTQLLYGSATSSAAGSVSSLLSGNVGGIPMGTLLVIGGGVLLLMMVMGGGGGGRR